MARTVGVSMVRDEEDIIGATVRHLLGQVDAVLIADNRSIDGTRDVLADIEREHPGRLVVVDDPDPAYRQSEKMTALATRARLDLGADWIVPFDADEWWYSPFGRIADVLAGLAAQWLVVPAPLFDHVATGHDPDVVDPTERLGWRCVFPNPLPKVACRWRPDLVIAQGNHDAYYNGGATRFEELLVVRHFPYRSVEQVVRKVRNGAEAYSAAGNTIPATFGQHWREWGQLLETWGPPAIDELFHRWYWRADPTAPDTVDGLPALIFDPVVQS